MMSAVFSRLTGAMTKVRPTSLAPSFDAVIEGDALAPINDQM
jgi:hypothetical protein